MPAPVPPPGFDTEAIEPPPLAGGPWPVTSIALDVSGRCNLACRYCAEAATQPARPPMSAETLAATWRLLDGAPARASRSVRLGSGEPLLALPRLRQIAGLIAQSGEQPPAPHLTTNGVLATRRVRDWLAATGWNVKISLDGPREIHDTWRVAPDGRGTFARIAPAVRDLAQRLPPERFSVSAVLCRGADPQAAFDGIAALGVRRIELAPAVHADATIVPGPEDVARYEAFVMAHARGYVEHASWADLPRLGQLTRHVYRLMGYTLARVRCGAGRALVGVGADGSIYPCFRFTGVERYRIGQLPGGVDPAAAAAFQAGAGRPYEQRAACRACWAAPLCSGPCFACAELLGPGDGQPLEVQCAYERATARAAVWLVEHFRRHDLGRLLGFFPESVTRSLQ